LLVLGCSLHSKFESYTTFLLPLQTNCEQTKQRKWNFMARKAKGKKETKESVMDNKYGFY